MTPYLTKPTVHDTARAGLTSGRHPGHTLIALHGELDIASTPAIRDRINAALNHATTPVIVDLSDVTFCDASGLALLVGTQRRANLHGRTIILAAPRPNVRKLLAITGLDRAFTIRPAVAPSPVTGPGY